jgi:biotin carboxyl carrier protein
MYVIAAYLIHHFYSGSVAGNSIWNEIGYWRMNGQTEVELEERVYNCTFRRNQDGLQIYIDQTPLDIRVISRNGRRLEVVMNGHRYEFYCVEKEVETNVLFDGFSFGVRSNSVISQVKIEREKSFVKQSFQNLIYADLFGKVLNLNLINGNQVHKGELLLTLESMKTEIHVLSPSDARIKKVYVKAGEPVIERQLLLELEEIVSADSN